MMEKQKKENKEETPSNDKSVTTANVEHLSKGEKRFISVPIHT